MEEQIIQILWDGPFAISDVLKFNGPPDKGLYQVYMYHPLYGDCLVYIGLTNTSFAARISAHKYEAGSDSDRKRVNYYVGRLIGAQTPLEEQWVDEVQKAEMLLIHSHAPAYNSTNIEALARPTRVEDVRVLNWGNCRSLQREVSGRMWSAPVAPSLRPYGSSGQISN
jgi:hypothetical protein